MQIVALIILSTIVMMLHSSSKNESEAEAD